MNTNQWAILATLHTEPRYLFRGAERKAAERMERRGWLRRLTERQDPRVGPSRGVRFVITPAGEKAYQREGQCTVHVYGGPGRALCDAPLRDGDALAGPANPAVSCTACKARVRAHTMPPEEPFRPELAGTDVSRIVTALREHTAAPVFGTCSRERAVIRELYVRLADRLEREWGQHRDAHLAPAPRRGHRHGS